MSKIHGDVPKTTKEYKDIIAVLEAENEQLRQKLKMLDIKLDYANNKCACYRNNQLMCKSKKDEENTNTKRA